MEGVIEVCKEWRKECDDKKWHRYSTLFNFFIGFKVKLKDCLS